MAGSFHLYQVSIERGKDHPEWGLFFDNVTRLNAKVDGYGGIDNLCVLKHHKDTDTVQRICTGGIRDRDAISVEEITRESLQNHHQIWERLVESYFLPYGEFPNL